MASAIGELVLVEDAGALTEIGFVEGRNPAVPPPEACESRSPFVNVIAQLQEYFRGERRVFDLPLALHGTVFQRRVWQALLDIPYGATVAYSDIAVAIGNSTAVRAVGLANGCNPIPIIIPCHRVTGRDGSLTGYGGGLPIKQKLLAIEGVTLNGRATRNLALFD